MAVYQTSLYVSSNASQDIWVSGTDGSNPVTILAGLARLTGIGTDNSGNVYAANQFYVNEYASGGASVTAVSFSNATAVAVDADGNIYVVDTGSAMVDILNSSWSPTAGCGVLGTHGSGPGTLNGPEGVAVNGSGASATVYVSDVANQNVQVFMGNGVPVSTWDYAFAGTPYGMAVDNARSRIYVADAGAAHQIDQFDLSGNYQTSFGNNYLGNR